VYYGRVGEEAVRGNQTDSSHGIEAPSGWVGTQQAARSLGVSPRTVRWHIEHGNLVAKPQGEGVRRTWLVSIDSLQAFRDARQSAGNLPRTDRAAVRDAHIAAEGFGNPIRDLADRLAEEAARAAEYRVRLELTEQAQTSLEEELATERRRREEAERERDELREQREQRELREELRQRVEVPSEPQEATEKGSEETTKGEEVTEAAQEPQKPSQRRERSWWRAFFGLE
jgi:hypothetical protein